MLPRSPGGILTAMSSSQDLSYTLSPVSDGSSLPESGHSNQLAKRRSTGTSEALQYYWSSQAGERASSSSSSIVLSPSNSPYPLCSSPYSLSPHPMLGSDSKSNVSLRELVEQEVARGRGGGTGAPGAPWDSTSPILLPRPPAHRTESASSDPGPSNRRIHLVSYPSEGSSSTRPASPDPSISDESQYSFEELPHRVNGFISASSALDSDVPVPYRGFGDTDMRRPVLEPSWEATMHSPGSEHETRRTPTQGTLPDRALSDWSSPVSATNERTPRGSYTPREGSRARMSTGETIAPPSSARLAFVAPPDVSRRSIDALEREIIGLGLDGTPLDVRDTRGTRGGHVELVVGGKLDPGALPPLSAPPTRSAFGDRGNDLAQKLPRPTSMLSPTRSPGGTSTPSRLERQPSPGRSPEPPPRSELRKNSVTPQPEAEATLFVTSPTDLSPKSSITSLPTIINTHSTPVSSPQQPSRAAAARVRSFSASSTPGLPQSGTIQDLTEMLAGAIDAIGLIDSRDTPPPTLAEPSKQHSPNLVLPLVPSRSPSPSPSPPPPSEVPTTPAPITEASLSSSPMTPTALPVRQTSLTSNAPQGTGTVPGPRQPQLVRKASSIFSVRSSSFSSPTVATFNNSSSRPWPTAMLYGNIKALKTPGDRAKGYARAINELSRADSGLVEWCISSAHGDQRPPNFSAPLGKKSTMTHLGVRQQPNSVNLLTPAGTHSRQVSTSSEFPMRPDSFAAREISARLIDPADQPTALPANLPYPQLQQQVQQVGQLATLKPSPSVQSLSSVSSSNRRGFFSRLSGKKESTSLGPPGAGYSSTSAAASKKDVRGLPISSPSYNPAPSRASLDSVLEVSPVLPTSRLQPSLGAPHGPRTQRASFDVPRTINTASPAPSLPLSRGSIDSVRSRPSLSATPRRGSPMGPAPGMTPIPSAPETDEAVRQMSDVFPHVDRAVLRAYVQRYSEPMQAITAYVEDEKRGTVMRV